MCREVLPYAISSHILPILPHFTAGRRGEGGADASSRRRLARINADFAQGDTGNVGGRRFRQALDLSRRHEPYDKREPCLRHMIHRDDPLPSDLEEAGNRFRTRCEQRIAAPFDHGLVIGNEPGADEIIAGAVTRLIDEPENQV